MKYIDNRLNANIIKLKDANNNYTSENVEGALEEIDSKINDKANKININVEEFVCDDGQYVQGDGIHDDTTGIRKALLYCKNNNKKLEFSKGKIYMVSQCYLYEGIHINGNGATLKMLPNSPKATRLLTMQYRYKYSSDIDSELIVLENIKFDGNSSNQGDFTNYEKEQQFGVFLEGDSTRAGRVFCTINNCSFENFCGDGVHFYTNTVVNCSNIFVRNCFRGGVVVSGGNSTFNINNYIVDSEYGNGLDIEVDVLGYGDKGIIANVSNIITNRPCDFGNLFDSGTKININNMISPRGRVNITVKYGTVNISNSTINKMEVVNCTNLNISNVTFDSNYAKTENDIILSIESVDTDSSLSRDKYNTNIANCIFNSSSGVKPIAIKSFLSNVKVKNCEFKESVNQALFAHNTPVCIFEENVLLCEKGVTEYKTSTISNAKYVFKNNIYLNNNTIPFIFRSGGNDYETFIEETYYNSNHLKFNKEYSYSGAGILFNSRKLICDLPESIDFPGLVGDIIESRTFYTDKKRYICTKSSDTSATWSSI